MDDEEEEGSDTVATILSVVGFLGAAAVVIFQIQTLNLWGSIGQLFGGE